MNGQPDHHEMPLLLQKINATWAGQQLQAEFQEEVAGLLKRNNPRHFPGGQPVSFCRDHLTEIKEKDYYVCEKTDGLRYLMYLTYDGEQQAVYLIDRKNEYHYVRNLFFPHHADNPGMTKFHIQTVIDGELVEDHLPDGSTVMKFLAFDLLVIDGRDMRERWLDKRLGYLKEHILKPYQRWLKKYPDKEDWIDFKFEDKKVELGYALPLMFEEIIPKVKLLHGNDGLIFTCKEAHYVSGTDPHILKWKPPEENTVDFLMHVKWQHFAESEEEDYDALPTEFGLYIYEGRNCDYSFVGYLYVTPEEWENMKDLHRPLQDSIVECFLEAAPPFNGLQNGDRPDEKRWRFHRFRDDKEEANHSSTFASVQQSIEDHVTQQDLLAAAEDLRTAWKAREARRPSRPQ